jgi:hypothetical protein
LWESDLFYSFLVDKYGLGDVPVISVSPNKIGGDFGKRCHETLPDGKTIAAAHSWELII